MSLLKVDLQFQMAASRRREI